MYIGGVPVEDYKHLGLNYESYLIREEIKGVGRILEKSLTDNSKVYDVQLFSGFTGSDDDDEDDYIMVPANNLWHARRILKVINGK